jgi:hypothetical protein
MVIAGGSGRYLNRYANQVQDQTAADQAFNRTMGESGIGGEIWQSR